MFQLCVSLTCRVVSDSPYTVAYVDGSAGGLDSAHLWACLEACGGGEKVESLMEKVCVFRAFSVYELLSVIHSIHHHVSHQVAASFLCVLSQHFTPSTLFRATVSMPTYDSW